MDTKAKAMKAKGLDIVNFGVGEADFDTPDHIKEAAIKAIREGFTKYTAVGALTSSRDAHYPLSSRMTMGSIMQGRRLLSLRG